MSYHGAHHAHHGLGLGFWVFVGLLVMFVILLRGPGTSSRIFPMRSRPSLGHDDHGADRTSIGMLHEQGPTGLALTRNLNAEDVPALRSYAS